MQIHSPHLSIVCHFQQEPLRRQYVFAFNFATAEQLVMIFPGTMQDNQYNKFYKAHFFGPVLRTELLT
jgi:hypothetical protein